MENERSSVIEAQRRAMSINRMVDYGMTCTLAERAHREVAEGAPWDACLEALAQEEIGWACVKEAEGSMAAGAIHYRSAYASLIFAQMAFNFDTDRKRALYARMTQAFAEHARRSPLSIAKVETPFRNARLLGWHCRTPGRIEAPTVIVFGGMSGWATAYLSMAQALCDRGLTCLLVDGPGQGESRLEGGAFMSGDVAAGFSRFVDLAVEASAGSPVGLWGNSFGGLLAALTAAADSRIAACCINGAPASCHVPPFRTAAEQMAAMLGKSSIDGLVEALPALSFDADRSPIATPVLVVEGGADPLVAAGTQAAFRRGNDHPLSQTLTWPDGEHTIYNHAHQRDDAVSRWFAQALR